MRYVSTFCLIAALALPGCSDDPAQPDPPTTGTVNVVIVPAGLQAPWTLEGPDDYTHAGTGDEILADLEAGDYDVTWGAVTNYIAPWPQSQTLAAEGEITFTGTYVFNPPVTGTVVVDVEPDDLDPGWVLKVETGDGDNDVVGSGDQIVYGVPVGEVTLDWEEIPGWEFSGPGYTTETLVGGGTLNMSVTYTVLPTRPLEFVRVEAGSFEMGSPASEPGAEADEWPQHTVTLTRSLHVSVTEITNAQWDHYMGDGRQGDATEPNQPVTLISWLQAVEFCNAVSLDIGYTPAYTIDGGVTWNPDATGFRLPTEAEWEYFARAGTTTAISAGELAELNCDPDPVLTFFGWYCPNATSKMPVASLYPNDWGLYDVHGNVGEFCWDGYASDYYAGSPAVDPPGPTPGLYRIVRGGNFLAYGANCRSAARQRQRDFEQVPHVGLRVVRNAEPTR